MARTRHVGVLLVVATLLLWGGAAAATASLSTSGGAVDTASTAQVQQQAEANASVTFDDQTAENGTVMVANVTVPEGGYVTIHDDSLRDGQAVGSVVGVSEYLEPGTHENVSVTLYEDVPGADFENATQPNGTVTLYAMAHQETSGQTMGNETTATTTEDGAGENQTTTTDGGSNETTTATTTTTTGAGNDTTTNTTTAAGGNETSTTTATNTTTAAGGNDTTTTTTSAATQQQNQTYDFVTSNGQEDGPYVVDGAAVTDSAEVQFGSPTADGGAGGAGGAETNDTETNATQAESSFVVESIEAPSLAPSNATITVNATVSNSADEERTEDVAFRLAGGEADVVVHQDVSVDAAGNETVTFELNASDVGEGEYIHGVTTENSSKFATIEVTDDAQVVFGDRESDGENVTVESVYLPEGGYVALHDASLLGGDAVGSVVGASEYLEPGVHENVSVTLTEGAAGAQNNASNQGDNASDQANGSQGSQALIAMAHQETNDNKTLDFVESDGEDDGPYTVDGQPVVDAGNLTVALENSPSGGSQDPNEN